MRKPLKKMSKKAGHELKLMLSKEIDRSHVTLLSVCQPDSGEAVKKHEQDTLHPDKGQLSPLSW